MKESQFRRTQRLSPYSTDILRTLKMKRRRIEQTSKAEKNVLTNQEGSVYM